MNPVSSALDPYSPDFDIKQYFPERPSSSFLSRTIHNIATITQHVITVWNKIKGPPHTTNSPAATTPRVPGPQDANTSSVLLNLSSESDAPSKADRIK